MGFRDDLLSQAAHLAGVGGTSPNQADLRRAVSSAYYAIFHLLVDEGATVVGSRVGTLPGSTGALAIAKIRRAFAHVDMKTVCISYAKATTAASFNSQLSPLLTFPLEPALQSVAACFTNLQEQRHLADYDMAMPFNRIDVLGLIDDVRSAFTDWDSVKATSNATIFLVDLLLRKAWSRV